jgi:hypothetical protein
MEKFRVQGGSKDDFVRADSKGQHEAQGYVCSTVEVRQGKKEMIYARWSLSSAGRKVLVLIRTSKGLH